jgi:hypothetical protein
MLKGVGVTKRFGAWKLSVTLTSIFHIEEGEMVGPTSPCFLMFSTSTFAL